MGSNTPEPSGSFSSRLLAKLRRTTTSGLYIPEIDGLRSVAIVVVICAHLGTFIDAQKSYLYPLTPFEAAFREFVDHGAFGVELFFALSGFIIAIPFAAHFLKGAHKVNVGGFYLRRLTRLEPPYIINLMMNSFVRVFVDHLPFWLVGERLLASLFYAHNAIYAHHSIVNLAAWSLEIEFQFYILAPLFLGVFAIKNPLLRRALIAGIPILCILLRPDWWRIEKSLLGKVEYFAVGILLTDIYLTTWRAALPRRRSYDFLAVAGFAAVLWFQILPDGRGVYLGRYVSLFLTLWGTLGGTLFSYVLRNRWIATFGGMCYTVYLYHATLLAVGVRLTERFTFTHSYLLTYTLQFVLNFLGIVIIGSLLFFFFEKPFMERDWLRKWKERLSRRLPPTQPTASPGAI